MHASIYQNLTKQKENTSTPTSQAPCTRIWTAISLYLRRFPAVPMVYAGASGAQVLEEIRHLQRRMGGFPALVPHLSAGALLRLFGSVAGEYPKRDR